MSRIISHWEVLPILTLQGGLRFNYNSLNKEFLISPRAQLAWAPGWKKDIVLKLAAGAYHSASILSGIEKV